MHRCVDTNYCGKQALFEGTMSEYKCSSKNISPELSGVVADYCRLMCNARGQSCPAYFLQTGNICNLVKVPV